MTEEERTWIDGIADYFGSRFLPIGLDDDAEESQLPIRPVRVIQRFDQEDFLTLLNSYPLMGSTRTPDAMGLLDQLNKVSERLGRWIDEWLDSGKTAKGVERPANRNYEAAKTVSAAVNAYSNRGKIRLRGIGNSLHLRLDLQDGKEAPTDRGEWPWRLFIDTVAKEKLVLFLLSDLSYKLAKCRKPQCGKYFVLKHWKRPYKTGTLCDECQRIRSLTSAAKATLDDRKEAKKELHHWAAKHFRAQIVANADWHANPELKDRIAQYLTSQIRRSPIHLKTYPEGISSKWVANVKNWNPIEAIVKKEGA